MNNSKKDAIAGLIFLTLIVIGCFIVGGFRAIGYFLIIYGVLSFLGCCVE